VCAYVCVRAMPGRVGVCTCLRACSLAYPACNAHAPYCHLWPLALPSFLHYLINGKIFEKKFTEHKICVLIFSTIVSKTFLILSIIYRDIGLYKGIDPMVRGVIPSVVYQCV
jgi:hypothetical protein